MTKLTLELPESAAKKLAALTPAQLGELSALLGYEVKSATIQPSEYTRRKSVNDELYTLTTNGSGGYPYLDAVPWNQIDAILTKHGFNMHEEGNPAGSEFAGNEGRTHVQVGPNTWLLVSWYRMPSGRYEVISYVS